MPARTKDGTDTTSEQGALGKHRLHITVDMGSAVLWGHESLADKETENDPLADLTPLRSDGHDGGDRTRSRWRTSLI